MYVMGSVFGEFLVIFVNFMLLMVIFRLGNIIGLFLIVLM